MGRAGQQAVGPGCLGDWLGRLGLGVGWSGRLGGLGPKLGVRVSI